MKGEGMDKVREALAELVEAMCAEFPAAECGFGAQEAWALRRIAAMAAAREALSEQPAEPRDDADRLVLRELFAVCEATEDECADSADSFKRGRAFEAKRIRRGIGTWYQDTFCGR